MFETTKESVAAALIAVESGRLNIAGLKGFDSICVF